MKYEKCRNFLTCSKDIMSDFFSFFGILLLLVLGWFGYLIFQNEQHLEWRQNKSYIQRDLRMLGTTKKTDASGGFFLFIGGYDYDEEEYVRYLVDNGNGKYVIKEKYLYAVKFDFIKKGEKAKMLCKEESDFYTKASSPPQCIFKIPKDKMKRKYSLDKAFGIKD